jgi:transcriptional/translational regulatory protein YebC/TACO1
MDLEELELELIDAGLEEIDEDVEEGVVYAYGEYANFGSLMKGIEDLGIQVKKSSLQRYPTTPVEFSEEQLVEIDKMLEKIEDDEDVQAVFTNMV